MYGKARKINPREEDAAWIKTLLQEEFPQAGEFFLYGSVSKMTVDWDVPEALQTFAANSDFDYAVQDNARTVNQLRVKGWQPKPESAYQDKITAEVYEKDFEGHKVQISLKTDLIQFKEIWRSVSPKFYWTFLNKRSPQFLGHENVAQYIDQLVGLVQGHFKEAVRAPCYTSVASGRANVGGNEIRFNNIRIQAQPAHPAPWNEAVMEQF
jgi:hypothetical protein